MTWRPLVARHRCTAFRRPRSEAAAKGVQGAASLHLTSTSAAQNHCITIQGQQPAPHLTGRPPCRRHPPPPQPRPPACAAARPTGLSVGQASPKSMCSSRGGLEWQAKPRGEHDRAVHCSAPALSHTPPTSNQPQSQPPNTHLPLLKLGVGAAAVASRVHVCHACGRAGGRQQLRGDTGQQSSPSI